MGEVQLTFTGGTYAEAKFNRLALVRGSFRFRYEIEADQANELANLVEIQRATPA